MPAPNAQRRTAGSPPAFDVLRDDLRWVDDALSGDRPRTPLAAGLEQAEFERWFDREMQQSAATTAAPLHRAPSRAAATIDVVDLTDDTGPAHGGSGATGVAGAETQRNKPRASVKRKGNARSHGDAPAITRPRTTTSSLTRPTRGWYPNSHSSPEDRQRLTIFRDQVASFDYDELITVSDPNRTDHVQHLFDRLETPLDTTLSGKAFFATFHHLIFAPVLRATPRLASLTDDGVLAHLAGLPADERAGLRSYLDVALSIAKAGKTTSFATICRAMAKLPGEVLPIYRLGQPYNRATLAAILASPGSNIEPPAQPT